MWQVTCRECGKQWRGYGPRLRLCRECEKEVRRRRQQERRQAQRAAREAARERVPCKHCGETFLPERSTARYCSVKCRVRAHRAKAHAPTEKRKTPWNKGRKWTEEERARHEANRERMRQEDEAYRERTRTREAKRAREKG
jgi:hypothetical protein